MISVSTSEFSNGSNFDPQESFADPGTDVTFGSADKDAVTFYTWVDNQVKVVFEGQNADGSVVAKTEGTLMTLAKDIDAGTIITLSLSGGTQMQVMAGTNGKIDVGSGSGDGLAS